MWTRITPHTLHICTGYKTNKRDCLKQSCLFVFPSLRRDGGGDFAVLRRGGPTQTQKRVK